MKKQIVFLLLTTMIYSGKLFSQFKIGNNPTVISASSVLEIESTNKGVLLPRMTGAQMNAIASPVSGMYVYNTDSLCLCQYNGTTWFSLCGTGVTGKPNFWDLKGNAGTVDGTNFVGTTDNVVMNFRVNNQKSGRIDHLIKNTFFGYQSGNSNSGTNNSFFGHRTGYSNTTGTYNTFAGDSAGYSNTTGVGNTAIGYQSLGANTTGSYNTAYGYQSLRANTTGQYNTGTGYNSLFSTTTGNNNTALGFNSGWTNTTGSNNTFIGFSADATANNFTKAAAIGYNAKVGASNSLVLGGTGADAVLTGTNTTTPNSRFQVNGSFATKVNTLATDASYTATIDDHVIIGDPVAVDITVTLPSAVGINGRMYTLFKKSSGGKKVLVTATGGQTINGVVTFTGLASQFDTISIVSDGANWIIISRI